ncbi:uncharacterized protein LOC111051632 isoform X1 [Nilaparvata lugens]|uniref:uncharacterized protein LOC111051632 isoform X1 n=1 Tax=Nilaparvata lugens TaxID=108931 RepID=UPI00193D5004|nr:uncharacterized protein LOC111051632 isoform X1 [Nilaparvata lugens]
MIESILTPRQQIFLFIIFVINFDIFHAMPYSDISHLTIRKRQVQEGDSDNLSSNTMRYSNILEEGVTRHKRQGATVNQVIDILPIELHFPGYHYCGPGTNLEDRLARGDPGINKLDKACKEHDIAYLRSSDTASRAVADRILAQQSWRIATSSDAGLSERISALKVASIMKAKAEFGGERKGPGINWGLSSSLELIR